LGCTRADLCDEVVATKYVTSKQDLSTLDVNQLVVVLEVVTN